MYPLPARKRAGGQPATLHLDAAHFCGLGRASPASGNGAKSSTGAGAFEPRSASEPVCPYCRPLGSPRRFTMIPFWIELNPSDLIQGTAVLTLALSFLIFNFFASAGRA